MTPISTSDILLTRLIYEVERISDAEHRLARRKVLLRQQITQLRLGAFVTEVRLAVDAIAAADHNARRWPADSLAMLRRDE